MTREGIIKRWAIADGRDALGTVRLDDAGKFVAIDVGGKTIGKFATLREAANAFDSQTERERYLTQQERY